jgi:hypothetical protein
MMLAGIPVPDRYILELAGLARGSGFDDVADKLEKAYDLETKVLALTISDREAILRALDDPPDGLAELRGVLLAEHEGRVRQGLV